ncbi:hypothetical protein M0805_006777 [Coniferiporia weirii]|nr:hypothetical protein M0805_006777 [Coniferiporia weirii]
MSQDAGDMPIPSYEDVSFLECRTLVLCFDGTNDQFDLDNTNVVDFFSALWKGDQNSQLVYYQSGFGTYMIPEVAPLLYSKISKLTDLMFAKNLSHHVMSGYKFLMQNYKKGDKICIFGFSRGAYTARTLAGMIHKVGLLPIWNEQQVPFAYGMYKDDKSGRGQSDKFKKAFTAGEVKIDFVGVWDTVASIGLFPTTLPFTNSNTSIKTFRHALSLDERRVKFKPYMHYEDRGDTNEGSSKSFMDGNCRHLQQYRINHVTDVLEVWFAGCHCDVGGGSVPNDTPDRLARISLQWMIRECFLARTGIQFNKKSLQDLGLDTTELYRPGPDGSGSAVNTSGTPASNGAVTDSFPRISPVSGHSIVNSGRGAKDALAKAHDQLDMAKWWWLLEYLPMCETMKCEDGTRKKRWTINRGRARSLPRGAPFMVHRSVKVRMESKEVNYKPQIDLTFAEWID